MNIWVYLEGRKETNIYEYEYIRLKMLEYIRMSEYSLHTGKSQTKYEQTKSKLWAIYIQTMSKLQTNYAQTIYKLQKCTSKLQLKYQYYKQFTTKIKRMSLSSP